jgi:flavin reductase (DIM6/NTAB) family NADH-FMN oxidoreductase RutF
MKAAIDVTTSDRPAGVDPGEVSPARLRAVMSGFATGVAVITTSADGELHGMTVNSLTSVSLEPLLLLVCLLRGTRTADAVSRRRAFVVNILDSAQQSISDRFARPGEDHFDGLRTRVTADGLPVLDGLAHLVCDVRDSYWGGDHVIVLGAVRALDVRAGQPLVYFRGKYDTLTGNAREAETLWYW